MKALFSAAVLCAATLLAGCGGGGTSNPNANPIATSVYVTQNGSPVQGISVTLSTGINAGTTPATPTGVIGSPVVTNSAGVAVFSSLPATGQICASATVASTFYSKCASPFPDNITIGN
jgi:hypothetical protein